MVLYVLAEPIFSFHKDFYLLCIYKHVGECCVKCQAFEDLVEKRVTEGKIFARRLIARGRQTLEEIAEDTDLPKVRELAGLQLA